MYWDQLTVLADGRAIVNGTYHVAGRQVSLRSLHRQLRSEATNDLPTNAATSFPKPEQAFGAWMLLCAHPPQTRRSGHRRAVEAEAMINGTRLLLARLSGFSRPERIVFTLNATDALNMAIKGVLQPGDHAITSVLEHNSISRPLNQLERDRIITLTRLPANGNHQIDPDEVVKAFRPATRLVALTHASNVTGTIQDIGAIGPAVRERNAFFLVDASQSAGVVPYPF